MGWEELHGTYTDIYFTTPDCEYFYGATIGAINNTVPEPSTVALILGGTGIGGMDTPKEARTAPSFLSGFHLSLC